MPITVNGISAILADGVRETTQTTGTGTYALDGAATVDGITYRTFVAGVGNGNATVYTVRSGSQFEVGIGTVASGAPATLTRSVILTSSSGGSAVNWGVGVKDIIVDCPADVLHSLQAQLDNTLARVKTTSITATGTFTRDADCLFAHVRIVGGGGGGGGVANPTNAAEGGGGGGGEYAEGWFTAAQIGASQSVTIGAAGAAGSSGGGAGGTGGTTSFGALTTAVGGSGGPGGVDQQTGGVSGGAGGTGGTGGAVRIPGGRGGPGSTRLGFRQATCFGGNSILGTATMLPDATGALYGGGGGGASRGVGEGADAGGPGAPGVCLIVEYCKA